MKAKSSVRGYGFLTTWSMPLIIGWCTLGFTKLWGSAYASSFSIIIAILLLGALQIVAEAFIKEDDYDPRNRCYTKDHLVDYNILTALFTAALSTVAATWMNSTYFMAACVAILAMFAIPQIRIWVGKRKMEGGPDPIHPDFRVAVWAIPFATGTFLIMSFYGHEKWGCLLYVFALGIHAWYMWYSVHHYTKRPAQKTYRQPALPHKAEHIIRSEIGQ